MFAEVVLATRTIGTGSSSLELSSIIKKEQKMFFIKIAILVLLLLWCSAVW